MVNPKITQGEPSTAAELSEDLLRGEQRRVVGDRIALGAVVLLLVGSGIAGSYYTQQLRSHTNLVEESHKLLTNLENIESMLQSAESGQRGYILIGGEFLSDRDRETVPRINGKLAELILLTRTSPLESSKLATLKGQIEQKLTELNTTMDVRRNEGFTAAQSLFSNNLEKGTMDSIHASISDIRALEMRSVAEREVAAAATYWTALAVGMVSTIAGLALVVSVVYLLQHNRRRAERAADIIRAEQMRLQASLDRIRRLEIDNRRMDQYMRSFVEQVKDYAIFAMDENCRATTWNNGVLEVLGFEEADFIGQDIRQLIFVPEAIELGIPRTEFETAAELGSASDDRWMMRKGGTRFWASGITSAVRDGQGNVVGFSKVMRDLTEQKRDEDELVALAAKQSESSRRMSEFMATLAHELRNPLAPIRNAIDLLAMSSLSPENEELRALLDRQVVHVIRLIDDLLDVSRIGRGKIILHREIVDLRTAIQSAIEASGTFIQDKGQKLQLDICDREVQVNVDPARITQVVTNLLNNSSRYTDPGGDIHLTLAVDSEDGEHGSAVLSISDNGIGISADRLDEIFQMFAQVDDSLGRGQAGLGIGLTLVKTLVELHRGTVIAESKGVGQGSLFTVRIPLVDVHVEPIEEEPTKEWPIANRTFQVLVVEDMRALRTIMARLLEKLGHRVRVAEDGLSALESITEVTPEVVFSDISMPGMTGYDLATRIRSQPNLANTYLVAMSGYGQLSDRKQSRDSGFNEHMVKPVDIAKLRDFFERLSSGHLLKVD